MKTIGLLGGMSWESTIPYYRIINETIQSRLGGLHSAKIVLHSVDFHEIELLQRCGKWEESGRVLARAALSLEHAGAELMVLCTNTMHKVAPAIEQVISIPLLHIVDPTGGAIGRAKISAVGLLGTKFTMEENFYVGRLREKYGLEVLVPEESDQQIIHSVIFDELCLGQIRESSRKEYYRIIDQLASRGAQGIILGCTEISLLVEPDTIGVPAFDTTRLHAEYAAQRALGESRE
jgi:aspartate racemase